VLDHDASTVLANPRLAELVGRDPGELPGVTATDLVDEDVRDAFRQYLHALDGDPTGAGDTDTVLARSDGTGVPVTLTPSTIPGDDGPAGWLFRVTE
jgi:PAS domain S-box-containing protein